MSSGQPTAAAFIAALRSLSSPDQVEKVSRFVWDPEHSKRVMGVPFGKVFQAAKQFSGVPLPEIEKLLDHPYFEARMGAVSIMDFQARAKSTKPEQRKALFDLYIRRHDRINNWDMVDRAAPHVVGRYLVDQPRRILYKLARSKNPWERRTAIVSTYYFIRSGDLEDTFQIAALLVEDDHELVQKAVGSWLREAGKRDPKRLLQFLETHAATMSRIILRYATEKVSKDVRAKFLDER